MNKSSNKRARPRGSNRRGGSNGGGNPNRAIDSSGPDAKVRGSAQQVADKYLSMARDASTAGDRILAENYFQHADHYSRVVADAQSARNANQQQHVRNERPRQQADTTDDPVTDSGMPADVKPPAIQVEIETGSAETEAPAPDVKADDQQAAPQKEDEGDEPRAPKARGLRRGLRGRPRRPRPAAKDDGSKDDESKADTSSEGDAGSDAAPKIVSA